MEKQVLFFEGEGKKPFATGEAVIERCEGPGRARERAATARSEGGASAPAHMLDRIGHITTTTEGEQTGWCEKYERNCVGFPCRTREGRCPYFDAALLANKSLEAGWKRRKAKGRAFWAIESSRRFYAAKMAWWLTLTNSPGSRPVYESWNVLRTYIKRLKRSDVVRWVTDNRRKDYSAKEERFVLSYYQGLDLDTVVDFQFAAVRTSEGFGVYHMFIYGDLLPVSWIRHHWKNITNDAVQIRIEKIRDMEKVRQYALAQYTAGQDQFVRFSMSRDLIYPGARKVWKGLVESLGYERALPYWKYCMLVHGFPDMMNPGEDWVARLHFKHSIRLVGEKESVRYWLLHPVKKKKEVIP